MTCTGGCVCLCLSACPLHEKSMIHLVISYFKTALIFWGFPFEKKNEISFRNCPCGRNMKGTVARPAAVIMQL